MRVDSPRPVAVLPSGALLVPGAPPVLADQAACDGPDATGRCPLTLAGHTPLCTDAEWHYANPATGLAWCTPAPAGSSPCPLVTLDPLGPIDPRGLMVGSAMHRQHASGLGPGQRGAAWGRRTVGGAPLTRRAGRVP